jgi:acetyltransferase-like isoleucine patch superfamily enzyme
MNSLMGQLWQQRLIFSFGSASWIKCWVKRVLLLKVLLLQIIRRHKLQSRGACLGNKCFLSSTQKMNGDLKLLKIGNECFIGEVEIAVHDAVTIGDRVCVNDGAKILTASHDVISSSWDTVRRPVVIEDYVWIATSAIILPGVKIGKGAVVGAGAVVSKNVEPYTIVVGNPARSVGSQRANPLNYSPVRFTALFSAWVGLK